MKWRDDGDIVTQIGNNPHRIYKAGMSKKSTIPIISLDVESKVLKVWAQTKTANYFLADISDSSFIFKTHNSTYW